MGEADQLSALLAVRHILIEEGHFFELALRDESKKKDRIRPFLFRVFKFSSDMLQFFRCFFLCSGL